MALWLKPPLLPEGNVIGVYSPKGGAGCSTIAINLAVAMARRGYQTVLVDGSLQFGDVSVMLNMKAMTSLADLSERGSELDADLVSSVVQLHRSGLNVLLAPPRPEMADMVTEENIKLLLENLRQSYDFVFVDTPSYLGEKTLAILDAADRIVLVTQQSLTSLKNVSRFFDLTESLEYDSDKTWLVVNKASNRYSISVNDIGKTLKRSVFATIPDEEAIVSSAADQGVPLVMGSNQKRPVSVAISRMAETVAKNMMDGKSSVNKNKAEESSGLFGRFFGRRQKAGG